MEPFFSFLANTPEAAHGQGSENFSHLMRLDNDQAVGLAKIAGQLGQKLVRGDAHRSR